VAVEEEYVEEAPTLIVVPDSAAAQPTANIIAAISPITTYFRFDVFVFELEKLGQVPQKTSGIHTIP